MAAPGQTPQEPASRLRRRGRSSVSSINAPDAEYPLVRQPVLRGGRIRWSAVRTRPGAPPAACPVRPTEVDGAPEHHSGASPLKVESTGGGRASAATGSAAASPNRQRRCKPDSARAHRPRPAGRLSLHPSHRSTARSAVTSRINPQSTANPSQDHLASTGRAAVRAASGGLRDHGGFPRSSSTAPAWPPIPDQAVDAALISTDRPASAALVSGRAV